MFPALNAAMVAQWGLFLDSSPCCPENDPRPCHVQAVVSFIKQWETMVASLRGLLAARKALGSCQKRSLTVLCRLLALVVGWQAVLSAEKVGELQRLVLKQVHKYLLAYACRHLLTACFKFPTSQAHRLAGAPPLLRWWIRCCACQICTAMLPEFVRIRVYGCVCTPLYVPRAATAS